MRLALASLLILLLAGCIAPDSPSDTESLSTGALVEDAPAPAIAAPASPTAPAEAPVWNEGDAWAITSRGGDAEEQAFVVVVDATSDSYTLATTSANTATFDAIFDISYVGKIRARDLAGAQQGTPVQFFDFPIEDGKAWSTMWDGLEISLTAKATPRGFAIEGVTPEGAPYVHYDYDPQLRWWSEVRFEEGYGLSVSKRVENWTGTVASATAKAVYEAHTQNPGSSPFVGTFRVDEGQTSLLLMLRGGGTNYARALQLIQPDGQPYLTRSPNTEASGSPREVFVNEQLPPLPGEWVLASPIVHDDQTAFALAVHQVVVEERTV